MIHATLRRLPHNPSKLTAANRPRAEIIQRWVETADERCPIASVWFALPEIAADQDDEPESAQPAFFLFRSKAGCLYSLTFILHPLSWPNL